MELNVAGAETVEVSDKTFGAPFNESLIHQVVVSYLASGRQGSKAQKSRSDVKGGGSKPWRQKGTGRARAGTIRSPIWRSGGKTFAATPKNYAPKQNKKMYRGAMRSILSELARTERLIVVDSLTVAEPKTRLMVAKLKELNVTKALIVTEECNNNLYLSSRNLPHVEVCDALATDPVSLLSYDHVVMTVNAIKKFEEMLG
ncbi:MAG: 50S ribosomal protein L4 [Endozoicomonadaceae bacterium]|nr:50S ribosomal protein L4 [Endozoicomonadaceae bacterium]MCY4330746.1 50S ribosomal protein L4 [Endozoicomonadaceae bacterium]